MFEGIGRCASSWGIFGIDFPLSTYPCALAERSRSLEEKEKTIVELRNNNRTLENFRYVLDHRLKQLMEER